MLPVVAATNRPDSLDDALLRPGRIDRILFVGPPDLEAREEILRINLKRVPHNLMEQDLASLAQITNGFSGAEMAAVCREAALNALRENVEVELVEKKHFLFAVNSTKPQITKQMLDFYEHFKRTSKLQNLG
jgi:SpoVK/Ycf46/Vps4 family AAA+-type ATPase